MSDTEVQVKAIESVVSLLKDISPYVMTLLTCGLIVWAVIRAGSAHFLFDKIWRLIGGGPISDPELKKEWLQERDMESFRFRTGIKFNTKTTWSRTLKWLEYHDKNLKDLSFARAWICGKPWDFDKPLLWQIRLFGLLVILLLSPLTLGGVYMLTEPSALLTIKESKRTFWTDGINARDFALAWNTPEFTLDLATCQKGKETGLGAKDRDIVCSSLKPENLSLIKGYVKDQKVVGVYVAFMCVVFMIVVVRYAARAKMARVFYELDPPRLI